MIKHIVIWCLKDEAEGFTREENAHRMCKEIVKMKDSITQIKKIEAGINIIPASDSFDVVLYSEFDSPEDLEIYQNHPVHQQFKEFIKNLKTEKRFIDYFI